jgi:hypothetical protein
MKEIDAKKLSKKPQFFGAKKGRRSIFSVFRSGIAKELGVDLEEGKKIYLVCIIERILGYLHKVFWGNKTFLCKVVLLSNIIFHSICLAEIISFSPFIISFIEKKRKIRIEIQ